MTKKKSEKLLVGGNGLRNRVVKNIPVKVNKVKYWRVERNIGVIHVHFWTRKGRTLS